MASVWSLVQSFESMRPRHKRFERVVFSRPDILYTTGMGPWCEEGSHAQCRGQPLLLIALLLIALLLIAWHYASLRCGYRNDTWYSGDAGIIPDMFWVMPRAHAALALGTSLRTLIECTPGEACCNANVTGRSTWIPQYWGRHRGLRVEENALLGSGVLARNPGKGDRDCTLHIGCWKMGEWSEEMLRG